MDGNTASVKIVDLIAGSVVPNDAVVNIDIAIVGLDAATGIFGHHAVVHSGSIVESNSAALASLIVIHNAVDHGSAAVAVNPSAIVLNGYIAGEATSI
jgi:hypothetical protein